jgi:hypothetical protein
LHFWATSVVGSAGVGLDNFGLDGGCDHDFPYVSLESEACLLAPKTGIALGVRPALGKAG